MAENRQTDVSTWMTPFRLETMLEMQGPTLTAMAEVNTKLCESLAAANREWTSFLNRRLKEDLAVPQQLAECRSLQDFYRVYAQILQNACSHYQAGLEQITKLSQSITENTLQTLRPKGRIGAEPCSRDRAQAEFG
jgi:hypothetical protein